MNPSPDPTHRDPATPDVVDGVDDIGGVDGVDDERRREIDLDEVVALLRAQGIEAEVEQTGGGCATIHAGPTRPHQFEPDTVAFAAIAGPGVYGWGQRPSIADLTDFYVGPDDDGESTVADAWALGARDSTDVVRLIAEQLTHPERPPGAAELTAAGFDPAAARAAREHAATLRARWCPPIPAPLGRGGDTSGGVTSGGVVVAEQLVTVAVDHGALRVGIHLAETDTVEFGDRPDLAATDNNDGADGVPIVLEVEGQVVFTLDRYGRAQLGEPTGRVAQPPRERR